MNGKIILVTGPARSGKSEWAEQLATESQKQVIYVATAQNHPEDQEWQSRIEKHQQRRPATWVTQHHTDDLVPLLNRYSSHECLLIDSLGTWVANHLEKNEDDWLTLTDGLLKALGNAHAELIFVAEETGWGVVPAYQLGRLFRDRLGTLTRQIASQSDLTYLVCAGIATNLKQIGQIVEGPQFQR